VFFTRNGKKLDDVAHGLKSQNLFPAVGANGPCTVHVNFGQSGFVFIEANVKKWGLAPMTGSLAPPPPYGSEQGSILLEAGRDGVGVGQSSFQERHGRSRSGNNFRFGVGQPTSPGPVRSPTDISLAHLTHIPTNEDVGEGTSGSANPEYMNTYTHSQSQSQQQAPAQADQSSNRNANVGLGLAVEEHHSQPPPDYSSPQTSDAGSRRGSDDSGSGNDGEQEPMIGRSKPSPPIPSYSDAVGESARDSERP